MTRIKRPLPILVKVYLLQLHIILLGLGVFFYCVATGVFTLDYEGAEYFIYFVLSAWACACLYNTGAIYRRVSYAVRASQDVLGFSIGVGAVFVLFGGFCIVRYFTMDYLPLWLWFGEGLSIFFIWLAYWKRSPKAFAAFGAPLPAADTQPVATPEWFAAVAGGFMLAVGLFGLAFYLLASASGGLEPGSGDDCKVFFVGMPLAFARWFVFGLLVAVAMSGGEGRALKRPFALVLFCCGWLLALCACLIFSASLQYTACAARHMYSAGISTGVEIAFAAGILWYAFYEMMKPGSGAAGSGFFRRRFGEAACGKLPRACLFCIPLVILSLHYNSMFVSGGEDHTVPLPFAPGMTGLFPLALAGLVFAALFSFWLVPRRFFTCLKACALLAVLLAISKFVLSF